MAQQLEGNVLITGGAGYIGRAIMHRAAQEGWPCSFIIYSRDEFKQAQCKRKFTPSMDYRYVLGDIRDTDRLELAMLSADVVIHAAALKYVPEAEANVSECISINVGGTIAVLDAARRAKVERVVCISTDKAVMPVNTYGMTKALVERLVTERSDNLRVNAVRYGNVIGSTGSVIPVMLDRLQRGQSLAMTDPEMTRFWMDANDAVDQIIFAAYEAKPGSVVVQVAKSLPLRSLVDILAGMVKDGMKIPVSVTGPRPGERKHEMLLTYDEAMFAHLHDLRYYEILDPYYRKGVLPDLENARAVTSDVVEYWNATDMKAAIQSAIPL